MVTEWEEKEEAVIDSGIALNEVVSVGSDKETLLVPRVPEAGIKLGARGGTRG